MDLNPDTPCPPCPFSSSNRNHSGIRISIPAICVLNKRMRDVNVHLDVDVDMQVRQALLILCAKTATYIFL